MTYKVLSCGTPPRKQKQGKVIAEGKVQLPSINREKQVLPVLNCRFIPGRDVLELGRFDREGKSICNWTYPIHLAKQYLNVTWRKRHSLLLSKAQKPDKRLTPLRTKEQQSQHNLQFALV